jgi:hypothetical protein
VTHFINPSHSARDMLLLQTDVAAVSVWKSTLWRVSL